jgi:hypothetical protein
MFVLTADGGIVPMKQAQFVLEDDFQELLAKHPELLTGDLIDRENPRRWILVSREIGVPAEMDGVGRWSADHLFLDQDGIPTIVEVKRQSDTRLRREVVGQMLDYAANAAVYWKVSDLSSLFEKNCFDKGVLPDQEIRERLKLDIDTSTFWAKVDTNLRAQKIRLLFIADSIPQELRRIVEFLNLQMNPAEVLALELRHYVGENGLKTLVPTLFGQTEEAREKKLSGATRTWNEGSFFDELSDQFSDQVVTSARQMLQWMENNAPDEIVYGKGALTGSIAWVLPSAGSYLYPFSVWTNGKVYINFRDSRKPPFDLAGKRMEFREKLNSIPGVKLPENCIDRMPVIPMEVLAQEGRTEQFLAVMDWFKAQLV